jgi:hypothetical protein
VRQVAPLHEMPREHGISHVDNYPIYRKVNYTRIPFLSNIFFNLPALLRFPSLLCCIGVVWVCVVCVCVSSSSR